MHIQCVHGRFEPIHMLLLFLMQYAYAIAWQEKHTATTTKQRSHGKFAYGRYDVAHKPCTHHIRKIPPGHARAHKFLRCEVLPIRRDAKLRRIIAALSSAPALLSHLSVELHAEHNVVRQWYFVCNGAIIIVCLCELRVNGKYPG